MAPLRAVSVRAFLWALLVALPLLAVGPAGAVSIELVAQGANPNNLKPGDVLLVDVRVSGLGSFTAPTVGAFDLTATFGDPILTVDSLTYGTGLSAPGFPSQPLPPVLGTGLAQGAELVAADPGACGAVESVQADSFSLFTLSFTAGAVGSTEVALIDAPPTNGLFLFDCSFTPIPLEVEPASLSVVVREVAEPASLLGALALLFVRRRRANP